MIALSCSKAHSFETLLMASFNVDSNGKRIKTDILVCGYIRHIMNNHKLQVPDEITGLCYLFWLIQVCDVWDKSLCSVNVEIAGSCARLSDGEMTTLFGMQNVKIGTFKWHLRLKTKINWGCIGIIKDDKQYIEQNKCDNEYGFETGCGCFLFLFEDEDDHEENGALWFDDVENRNYANNPTSEPGTIIEITLNMDDHTIKYKINDTEYKTVKIESLSSEIGYKLAITIDAEGDEIELI